MARYETQSITVGPREEQATIEKFEMFGWNCVSSQTVDSKDSHLESRDDGLYNVTEHVNYVKLVFKRDRDMDYYRQIVNCESRYDDLMKRKPYERSPRFFKIIGTISVVLAVIMLLEGILYGDGGGFAASLLFFASGIPLTLLGIKRRKNADDEYEAACSKWNASLNAIIDEVRQYV